jgi:hypothetical protein|uniref:Uncharacterized protein n=1 Tax=Sipha flava TaxID=143950 RepID=A0A2S2R4U0_9HEMI
MITTVMNVNGSLTVFTNKSLSAAYNAKSDITTLGRSLLTNRFTWFTYVQVLFIFAMVARDFFILRNACRKSDRTNAVLNCGHRLTAVDGKSKTVSAAIGSNAR